MLNYVSSVDKVLETIEKMSRYPTYQNLDPEKHQESLINWLMKDVNNARASLFLGCSFYCDGLSEKYIPDVILGIIKKFCKEKISEEVAYALIGDVYNKLERVITSEMGYTYDKGIDMYVKQKQQKKRKRYRRILKRK